MRKRIFATATAAIMAMAMATTAFAGSWKLGVSRPDTWWYDNEDGTWAANGWHWIDGDHDGVSECYYFDADGWMLANTTTPDGYTVNENGAWVENGAVQTKSEYRVVNSGGDVVKEGTIAQAEVTTPVAAPAAEAQTLVTQPQPVEEAPVAVVGGTEESAKQEAVQADVPTVGGDLTKAATLAGTYKGVNDEGGEITAVLVANSDNTITMTVTNPVATWTDTYQYEGTFERGIIWGYENENGKDSIVAMDGKIDIGWILAKQ